MKTVTAGTIGLTGLAGCTGGGGSEATTTTTDATTETTESMDGGDTTTEGESSTDYKPLEVQHWWTGGDGNKAVTALFEGFKQKYPDIKLKENPVPGGGGTNLHTVIKKRVLNNNPPSSWQAWPGKNLQPFVEAGKLKDIGDSVWSKNGMKDAYLKGPKDAAKPGGKFVTVPINIHRLNNLFYNKKVVEKAGVDPASISKPSDLVAAMKKVENNTDAVGMAHSTKHPWPTLDLWEAVLLGEYGRNTYQAVAEGKIAENQQAVKGALQTVKDYKQYFNEDNGSVSWTEANTKVINGEAAFYQQGDWAAGMYRGQDGFEFGTHWDQVSFPGSKGVYAFNMDSFPFPKNNPSPKATEKFLQYCGSVDAQERFNPKKGSIPPRTDVPKDEFGPFLQRQMDDFKNSKAQVPSITHGLAVAPEPLTGMKDATATFTSDWNVDKTFQQMKQAFN
ncbi:extracellular solute-binding protein [Halorussus limi]|uniref:Extracellular solute-binding protein n=1 Tax=Halorussus limi TaxID=2938695 RepID=A0A8U0HTK8_9EURY|nr:extracellular solute-binding protein [Halorussus limi]UPV74093.1 extracellular solute-binding protein [Halorussus limi]